MSNRRERRANQRTNKKIINKLVSMCMGNPVKGMEEMSKMGVDPGIQNQIMQAAFFKRASRNPELMELAMKANEERGTQIIEEQHEDISPEQA